MQTKEYFKNYYQKNREKKLEYQNEYNRINKSSVATYQKAYNKRRPTFQGCIVISNTPMLIKF